MKIEFNLEVLTYLCAVAPELTNIHGKFSHLDDESPEEIPLYRMRYGSTQGREALTELIREEGGEIWFCGPCNGFASTKRPCEHRRWFEKD